MSDIHKAEYDLKVALARYINGGNVADVATAISALIDAKLQQRSDPSAEGSRG
jgi:hypothetical protein